MTAIKIEYRAVGAAGGYTTLADFSAVVRDFKPDFGLQLQSENGAFAPVSKFRSKRGNVSGSLTLEITQTYADADTASAAARTAAIAFLGNTNQNLKVTKGTADVEYYPNCSCHGFSPNNKGSTIEYSLKLETDLVTATEPA